MVLKRYAAADFLASASDFETFGNTCAEAASVGTPALVQRQCRNQNTMRVSLGYLCRVSLKFNVKLK